MRVWSSASKGCKLVQIFRPAFSKKSSIAAATNGERNTRAKKYGTFEIKKALRKLDGSSPSLCFKGPVLLNKRSIFVNFATSVSLQV